MALDRVRLLLQSVRMNIDAHSVADYQRTLQRYFGRRVREHQDVPDLVQETFVRLLASDRASDLQSPMAYLIRIGSNLVADRGRRRSPLLNAHPVYEDDVVAVAPTQEQDIQYGDLQRAFESALAELPARCQQVFLMRRYDDMSTSEIAVKLDISHRMVQKYMVRAMSHFQRRLHHFVTGNW